MKHTIITDPVTGIIIREEWWKDGKEDRDDGPAIIERDAATGAVTREVWWKDGKKIAPPSAQQRK